MTQKHKKARKQKKLTRAEAARQQEARAKRNTTAALLGLAAAIVVVGVLAWVLHVTKAQPLPPPDFGAAENTGAPPTEPAPPPEPEPAEKPPPAPKLLRDAQFLVGRWVRTDFPYTIEILGVDDDGTLDAAYYNPGRINVGRAEAREQNGAVTVFVELRDINYPGSTYTLTYEGREDVLRGVYYQAVLGQKFNVTFARAPASR